MSDDCRKRERGPNFERRNVGQNFGVSTYHNRIIMTGIRADKLEQNVYYRTTRLVNSVNTHKICFPKTEAS